MIEFELKFKVEQFNIPPILEKMKEQKIVDLYYDTKDYLLLKKGCFFRLRNNQKVDFKMNGDIEHLYCTESSFNPEAIHSQNPSFCSLLNGLAIHPADSFDNLETFLKNEHFIELAKIQKERIQYRLDRDIIVSYDILENLGFFVEAEIHLNNDDKMQASTLKDTLINKLVQNKIISRKDTLIKVGYVELYLYKHNKSAYELGKFKL